MLRSSLGLCFAEMTVLMSMHGAQRLHSILLASCHSVSGLSPLRSACSFVQLVQHAGVCNSSAIPMWKLLRTLLAGGLLCEAVEALHSNTPAQSWNKDKRSQDGHRYQETRHVGFNFQHGVRLESQVLSWLREESSIDSTTQNPASPQLQMLKPGRSSHFIFLNPKATLLSVQSVTGLTPKNERIGGFFTRHHLQWGNHKDTKGRDPGCVLVCWALPRRGRLDFLNLA